MSSRHHTVHSRFKTITGTLSRKTILIPVDEKTPPIPDLVPPGIILNGEKFDHLSEEIDPSRGYPDVRSFRRKFGLLIPATNTSMEHELWNIIFKNQGSDQLAGVGLHTSNIPTPRPKLTSEKDLFEYQQQILAGLKSAIEMALFAQPQYLILGMSLEHVISGIEGVRAPMTNIEADAGLSCATWHDAAPAALEKFGAKRIGLVTPFDKRGNENATRMFEELGYTVVASVGFSCAHALHIAHVPDLAKEKAILELTSNYKLDAIVQCGTNMSMISVCEKLEPIIGIPILGVNAVTFWYALRENGFTCALAGAGRLFREF